MPTPSCSRGRPPALADPLQVEKASTGWPLTLSAPTPHRGTPRLGAFTSPKPQMGILKELTTTLVEDLQAPVPAGRVRGPGLAAGGHERPHEEGGRETLHGEALRATHSERRARDGGPPGGSSSRLLRWVTCSVSVLFSVLWEPPRGAGGSSQGHFGAVPRALSQPAGRSSSGPRLGGTLTFCFHRDRPARDA